MNHACENADVSTALEAGGLLAIPGGVLVLAGLITVLSTLPSNDGGYQRNEMRDTYPKHRKAGFIMLWTGAALLFPVLARLAIMVVLL